MRKLGAVIVLFAVVFGVGRVVPVQAQVASATVLFSSAKALAGPGIGFWSLGTLHSGETIPVVGITADKGWWQVNTRFGTGFVAAANVSTVNTEAVPVVDPGTIGVVTGALVTVRRGPGIGAVRIGLIAKDQQFFLLATQQGTSWIRIRFQGGTGWINSLLTSLGGSTSTVVINPNVPVAQGPTAIINTAALNVRTGPGTDFKTIGTLSGGDIVSIIGKSADGAWIEVDTIFGKGWINIGLVIPRNYFGNVAVTDAQVTTAEKEATVLILTGTINVRSGPNIAFPSITTVNAGAVLTITGQSADRFWWQVDTPAGKGWISKALVQAKGAFSSVPVVK